jgi:tetratricopeptide (TPR) repeat protein
MVSLYHCSLVNCPSERYMTKVIKITDSEHSKFGHRKASYRKKKINLEDFGQLNLFDSLPSETKVVKMGVTSFFEEALTLDNNGDERSREMYARAIEAGDCIADAFCNLGIIESNEGNIIRAIDCFTNCLRHEPRHFEAHYNLANIYADAGNLKLAQLHYEIAVQLEPYFASGYYNLGLVLALDHQIQPAIAALIKYKELAPDEEKITADELIKSLESSLKK